MEIIEKLSALGFIKSTMYNTVYNSLLVQAYLRNLADFLVGFVFTKLGA